MTQKTQPLPSPPRSKFTAVGCLLMLAGVFVAPVVATRVSSSPDGLHLPLALLTDGLRAGFFLGVAFVVIGLLRNRRARQLAARRTARMPDQPPPEGAG